MHPAVLLGAQGMGTTIQAMDNLATRIRNLPAIDALHAPELGSHIEKTKTLANNWLVDHRSSLVAALTALDDFGIQFMRNDAPQLATVLQTIAVDPTAGSHAASMVTSIRARLQVPANAAQAALHSIELYLTAVLAAAGPLQSDASALCQRLQTDQQTAATLEQQAQDLQGKLNDASSRARWYWLLGPLAAILAREIDSLASNLSGVESQLNTIHFDQATTAADTAALQVLLPGVSAYVDVVGLMGASINGLTAGTQALQAQLEELATAIGSTPAAGAFAQAQLDTAVEDWRDISKSIVGLRQSG
jgi:hypothetical protein